MNLPIENEQVIAKIQKLLALGQSDNEAEASLAMARAQEMLAKYNLDYAMVTATHVAGGTVAAAEEKREKVRISRSAQYNWQRSLWKALAQANFCWHSVVEVYEGKRGTKSTTSKVRVKRHMILGRESNVIAVRLMGEYLEDTMERILPFPNNERLSRSAISWKAGCADRLVERIEEQAEARKEASEAGLGADSTAMVLRSVYEKEYAANYDARYGTGKYAQKLLDDAEWSAGQAEREQAARERTEQKEREWLAYLQTETPEQKKGREKKEAKEALANAKYWARQDRKWNNEQNRESAKVDHEAYRSGSRAGKEINLGAQVAPTKPRKDRSLE